MRHLRANAPRPPSLSSFQIGRDAVVVSASPGAVKLKPQAWYAGSSQPFLETTPLRQWIARSLNRKFIVASAAGLLAVSLIFLLAFVTLYRSQLQEERTLKASEVNRLLQAALINAMLKRDLEGLRQIIDDLGKEGSIRQVMILNPAGEVRFASDHELIGTQLVKPDEPACPGCLPASALTKEAQFTIADSSGRNLLRAVHPVRNQARCAQCHGPTELKPINGILVVDHEADTLRTRILRSTGLLMGSGAVVVMLSVVGGWWFIDRFVLKPVAGLATGVSELASGRLEARVTIAGADEISQLARTFNQMAENLAHGMETVREQQAFLQNLIDAIPDGIRVIGPDYRIVLANQTYAQHLGQTVPETIGAACHRSSHQRDNPCPPQLIACPLVEIAKTGVPIKTLQSFIHNKDGAFLHVEVYGAPMRVHAQGKETTYIVESIRDLAKQLQYSHQQKHATLSQLAAGVAHEIRNPLASIRIALDTLFKLRDGGVRDDEQLYEYLHLTDRQIDRCIDITERLLRLSLPPGQSPDLVSINSALQETISLLTLEALQRGVTIELMLSETDARTVASDSEIRIVIVNLTQNAFHAMPNGGVLRVSSRADEKWVAMEFADTGTGIRPDDLPYIFDPFFSRRADGGRGTGLGLPICRAIAERWGGEIQVATQLDHGSRFRVRLPDADATDFS